MLGGRAASQTDLASLAHTGELLPDWYDDWVLPEREQMREMRILALEAAADELITAHSYPEAAMAAGRRSRGSPA